MTTTVTAILTFNSDTDPDEIKQMLGRLDEAAPCELQMHVRPDADDPAGIFLTTPLVHVFIRKQDIDPLMVAIAAAKADLTG
jgi:hypothetical protein